MFLYMALVSDKNRVHFLGAPCFLVYASVFPIINTYFSYTIDTGTLL